MGFKRVILVTGLRTGCREASAEAERPVRGYGSDTGRTWQWHGPR